MSTIALVMTTAVATPVVVHAPVVASTSHLERVEARQHQLVAAVCILELRLSGLDAPEHQHTLAALVDAIATHGVDVASASAGSARKPWCTPRSRRSRRPAHVVDLTARFTRVGPVVTVSLAVLVGLEREPRLKERWSEPREIFLDSAKLREFLRRAADEARSVAGKESSGGASSAPGSEPPPTDTEEEPIAQDAHAAPPTVPDKESQDRIVLALPSVSPPASEPNELSWRFWTGVTAGGVALGSFAAWGYFGHQVNTKEEAAQDLLDTVRNGDEVSHPSELERRKSELDRDGRAAARYAWISLGSGLALAAISAGLIVWDLWDVSPSARATDAMPGSSTNDSRVNSLRPGGLDIRVAWAWLGGTGQVVLSGRW
ncbi:hypothetical protein ACFL6C_11995 [Myxococcota bacterium]